MEKDLVKAIEKRAEIARMDAEVRGRITRRLARVGIKMDYEGNVISKDVVKSFALE